MSSVIRSCFVPRQGRVFLQADYSALELFTLAQVCIDLVGESALAASLNTGKDPHLAMGANILGITYEEAVSRKKEPEIKDARQLSKAANFGLPGGLGVEKFILFAKNTYGVSLTVDAAKRLKAQWFETWPEMRKYFSYINTLGDHMVHVRSNRGRGGARYTAMCNSFFQGLGADVAKHSLWLVSKACYTERESVLFGCRPVLFVHDEIIVEAPEDDRMHLAVEELSRLMVVGAKHWLPDLQPRTEHCIMRFWSKDAEPTYDSSGKMVPWPQAS